LKINPKVHLEAQQTANSQGNTQQKEQCWRYHNTQLQTILQSHSNKNNVVLAKKKNRYEDQWNRIEDPDMNPHSYAHSIFDKGAQSIKASSTNVAEKTEYLHPENRN
jgi:hypothetical protein